MTSACEDSMPVTLLLLLLAFGSLVAAVYFAAGDWSTFRSPWRWVRLGYWRIICTCRFCAELATMLGLGLGIDYALLMVSRFREALDEGYDCGRAADLLPGKRADADHLATTSQSDFQRY